MRKLNLNDFIERARKIHGDKYDYSKVNYINSHIKVCIICPEHGEFWQTPDGHLSGRGCPVCRYIKSSSATRLSKEEFIKRAKEIHGNKYDYSKVEYKNTRSKVCIICPEHGEFWQIVSVHLSGKGCPYCSGNAKLTTEKIIERFKKLYGNKYDYSKVDYTGIHHNIIIICPIHGEFNIAPKEFLNGNGCPKCGGFHKTTESVIEEFRKIHGNKYDYSKLDYKNNHDKLCIICPEHGEFWQDYTSHKKGVGCPYCSGNAKLTTDSFIEKAKQIHGNKYNYSKVEYKNNSTEITIICSIHGEFYQKPQSHLAGSGCPKCAGKNKTTEDFIKELELIHGNKYDYSRVEYINAKTKVCIICHEKDRFGNEHGEFWITPNNLLNGKGCRKCNNSKLESITRKILKENKIIFEEQKHFNWLGLQSYDFYLPELNLAIECQGSQHYDEKSTHYSYIEAVKRDKQKLKLTKENNINILYVFENNKSIDKALNNKDIDFYTEENTITIKDLSVKIC